MLFDIRGKRKRVVQVVYAGLALLFLVGFVGFGIGVGGGPGGILDAVGLGGDGSTGSATAQFNEEIDAANAKLAKDPNDTKALLKLADNEYLKAKEGIQVDANTGQITSVSNEAHTGLGNAVDAWAKYLKVNKGKPDATVAFNMVEAYTVLGDAQGAADTQRIIAEDQPSSQTYGQLAFYEYLSGDIAAGDAARDKAVAEAPKAQQKSVESQLASIRKQGLQIKKQQAKAGNQQGGAPTPGTNPLQNPFGGVGTTP